MNANAYMDLLSCLLLGIVRTELRLNSLGALYSVDDGRKVYQERIVDRLDDVAVILSHRLLDDLVMSLQQPQHAGFISPHLAAKADDVGEHDRGQFAGLSGPCATGVRRHGGDYPACSLRLSKGASTALFLALVLPKGRRDTLRCAGPA